MKVEVIQHSILSGLFAAQVALFGKLTTSPDIAHSIVSSFFIFSLISSEYLKYCVWIVQFISLALMIGSNAIMWSQYSLALALSQATLHVTAINTVSNFIFTVIIGRVFFEETISLQWILGIMCILFGIVLLKEQSDSVLSQANIKTKNN